MELLLNLSNSMQTHHTRYTHVIVEILFNLTNLIFSRYVIVQEVFLSPNCHVSDLSAKIEDFKVHLIHFIFPIQKIK